MKITDEEIQRIKREFEANFAERGEVGASVSIWEGETEVLNLHGGYRDRARSVPWNSETIVPFWSTTKGLGAACVLLALDEAEVEVGEPVASIWPELEGLTFSEILAHEAGFAALDEMVAIEDYKGVISAIEKQAPNWPRGDGHGYHSRTIGFLMDEIVRRLSGADSLGVFFRDRIAEPLELDLWIGLPPEEDDRVAELLTAKVTPGIRDPVFTAFGKADSLSARAFRSPRGLNAVSDFNKPENRRISLPALSGIGSASSLAKFYAVFAQGGVWGGHRYFSERMCRWAETIRSSGHDQVLLRDTAFSAGFQMDPIGEDGEKLRELFGPSKRAFGHPGAGGSHAFADPDRGISFGYVMNQMELSILPTDKATKLLPISQ